MPRRKLRRRKREKYPATPTPGDEVHDAADHTGNNVQEENESDLNECCEQQSLAKLTTTIWTTLTLLSTISLSKTQMGTR